MAIDRDTVLRLARQAVNSGDGSELSGDAIERFAQLVFLEAAHAPVGWKLVPVEATPAMTAAAAATPGVKAIDGASQVHQARGYPLPAEAFAEGSALEQAWRAMLAAAPQPPHGVPGPDGSKR